MDGSTPLVSNTSLGGTTTGSLLQTNIQRLTDRLQGAVIPDLNKALDVAQQQVDVSLGVQGSVDPAATTRVENSPSAQQHLFGMITVAALVIIAVFAIAVR